MCYIRPGDRHFAQQQVIKNRTKNNCIVLVVLALFGLSLVFSFIAFLAAVIALVK